MNHSSLAPDGLHPGWRSLVAAGFPAPRIDTVLAYYREPHRRYHDQRHIRQMLDDAARFDIALSPAQALAVLFHDSVYVPGATHGANEALSAQLLRVFADDLDARLVQEAAAIVIDTARHQPSFLAATTVLDLDLLRLAAPAAEFDRNSLELFVELHPLSTADDPERRRAFALRQIRFFENLLARPRIYHTPAVFARCETVARANLRAAIGQSTG